MNAKLVKNIELILILFIYLHSEKNILIWNATRTIKKPIP